MSKVAVIGAGSWGTALSIVLADNGCEVAIYARRQEQVDEINHQHTNHRYLPDITLPANIVAYPSYRQVLEGAQYVLIALPTAAIRTALREMVKELDHCPLLIHSSKGLEPDTYKRVSEMIAEEVPESKRRGIVVLSGPSHAEEVSRRSPTTVVVAAPELKQAEEVQDLFINQHFRVYTNTDMLGVEIGGALKNIIALGAGLSDGLGYGDNAKAALMTRGLTEIARLGVQMGAHPLTFAGLAGVGDLIVTCTSRHSRNWRCGYAIGQGKPLNEVLQSMGMVVEGVRTTKAAYQIAQDKKVEMPITKELYHVLFEGKSPRQAVDDLMGRGRTHEMESRFFDDFNRYF
ncbi:NAD(P)H-dependent glycerol-3-phosphate dehydrogenase [Caldalkalibacillus thermarum TA2.A1]|uniref:Glycerol-3-phosphate dehydrogenase [NAD(P)+] n=1 Tax=Caldalkalibacillus thermarum (strain TA2.A1) TaxID=986075 RepID=A0A8X8L962_CALTT|nr:NAD(P)H-dependent glycerol-3-phosphate dehydrogenase [Caldalkalibacillus thermarum]QZT32633.1 NAD(P)H-dependent glycerol-3-phosphate dehydrogenase [Caldalkalibacillus thermarum TA2.A1]